MAVRKRITTQRLVATEQVDGQTNAVHEYDEHQSADYFRTFGGSIFALYECPKHGLAGWNVPGTPVQCRQCGQPLFASIADLIFTDPNTIKPLCAGGE